MALDTLNKEPFGQRELEVVEARFKEKVPNLVLDKTDWARFGFALELMAGSSVADIGTGHGVMVNAVADSKQFSRVSAFDIRTHSQALIHDAVDYYEGSIADPNLDMPLHDTVVCMEVVEHLEEQHNEVMLANLRRLAKRRLIVTVPYDEPEPLWWHDKPGGHRQKFDDEKLARLFPNAIAAKQPRYGVDWIFIVEDTRISPPQFTEMSKDEMRSWLGASAI